MSVWRQRTPLGDMTLSAEGGRVESVWLGDGPAARGQRDESVAAAFAAYFGGDLEALDGLDVDLDDRRPFTAEVYRRLRGVGPGSTTSYGELAAMAGRPGAARAVGQIVGANPVAIVVPCHRVVAADGTLGGYGGGLDVKRWLLAHEGVGALAGGWSPARRRGPLRG